MTVTKVPPPPVIDRSKPGPAILRKPGQVRKPAARAKKTFKVEPYDNENRGHKIVIYADSGMGKTTLAALAPKPAFIGLDGGLGVNDPVTGEPLKCVPGVETFSDVRDALQDPHIFDDRSTVVIDTITHLESLAEPWMFRNIPGPKGKIVANILGYGYNHGYQHLYDTFRLILQDCDSLIRRGKNVILIAQNNPSKIAHAGGEDFLQDGPRLYSGKHSNQAQVIEWADHVFKIGYVDLQVEEKKVSGSTQRVVYVHPEVFFFAKSRTISHETPVINFSEPSDDSVWVILFGDK